MKKNFQCYDEVRFVNTSDAELDKNFGQILGKSADFAEVDFYIVKLDRPYMGWAAIQMIESCLELI